MYANETKWFNINEGIELPKPTLDKILILSSISPRKRAF